MVWEIRPQHKQPWPIRLILLFLLVHLFYGIIAETGNIRPAILASLFLLIGIAACLIEIRGKFALISLPFLFTLLSPFPGKDGLMEGSFMHLYQQLFLGMPDGALLSLISAFFPAMVVIYLWGKAEHPVSERFEKTMFLLLLFGFVLSRFNPVSIIASPTLPPLGKPIVESIIITIGLIAFALEEQED